MGFFDAYGTSSASTYQKLAQQLFVTIFLSQDEQTFRQLRFLAKRQQHLNSGCNGWDSLSIECIDKKDYLLAKICLESAKTSEAWYKLGFLYGNGHIGRKTDGTPDYEQAAECYQESKTPNAWFNLGLLYREGHIGRKTDGTPDYEQAAKCYRQSKTPEACYNLGILYDEGHIGRKTDGTPDYEQAAECYRQSKAPEAWHNLGFLYYKGHIGRKTDGTPDYEQALLHMSHAAVLGLKEAIEALKVISQIIDNQEKLRLLQQDEPVASVDSATAAAASPSTAAAEGQSDEEEESSDLSSAEDDDDPTEPVAVLDTMAASSLSTAAAAVSPGKIIPKTKIPMTKGQKIERAQRNLAKAIAKAQRHATSMGLMTSSHSMDDKKEKVKPLVIKFVNKNVERQYNALSVAHDDGSPVTTLPELIKDIQLKPWGTEGLGQPEVLREKKYRGYISRRIGGEEASGRADRLVYKVTGPGEITVLEVGGHYARS